ncbi:MAG: tRNA (adenosine(37)-N6)-threonylcarbamoyltransferase complex dimerization subunit type 1 TsaB [Acidobacteriia bacterium]|nr:tRNA (adenosine(37)-N6)-threonylcarbamoyltransferase complex dimerization subunit type 1 TsaB [Terriglobia bacterium]
MLILAIDTSTRTGSAALLRDGVVLAEVSGKEETPYSSRLFRDVETLKLNAKFSLDQVDVFAVASGPGSFTGLRIGLTAVKAWAEIHGKPIAAISGLEAIAAQSQLTGPGHSEEDQILAPFFDARRGQLFGSLYRRSAGGGACLKPISEESIVTPEEFLELVKGSLASGRPTIVTPVPELLPSELVEKFLPGVRIELVSAVLAPTVGRLGFERAMRGDLLDALRLDANYVRRSDAEAAWSDR